MDKNKPETYQIKRKCSICGKEMKIIIEKGTNKIVTKCWYNKIDTNYFDGWGYREISKKNNKFVFTRLAFKNWKWRLLGLTTPQRELVYWLWKQFHIRREAEMWECSKCTQDLESPRSKRK